LTFIENFQGTYTSWDLCNYRQRSDETQYEYVQRFSKKRNELPNIMDTNVINAFTYDTTYEALIHTLRREASWMMRELLDVATKYAIGEEAILASFSDKGKACAHHSGRDGDDEAATDKKKDRKHCSEEMVAAADCTTRPQPKGRGQHLEHFERALDGPYLFHGGQVRHLLKDCETMRS
jgi:hypothetical protein